jgi:hypothetical protein
MPRPPRLLRCFLLLVPIGFAIGCATAPAPPPDYTPAQLRVHRLLSGIYLRQYVERIETVSLRRAGKPPDGELPREDRIRQRIQTQLAPDAVVSDVVRRISESFDEPSVEQIERFGESAVGRKVREAAGVPYSAFSRLGYRIFGGPTDNPPERVALVRKLDELTQWSQTSTDLYLRVYGAIVRWYDAVHPMSPERSASLGGVDGLVAREREQMEAISAQHAIPFTLYAFSDLSTPDLAEYVAVVESPAGQWYTKAVREALTETIDRRAAAIESRPAGAPLALRGDQIRRSRPAQ